ncbi:MAG: hypothetical protein QG635_2078 [Bacteroidota bacterium]|nr:hypothetical protein [Bacteroidota bacterium]
MREICDKKLILTGQIMKKSKNTQKKIFSEQILAKRMIKRQSRSRVITR